MGTEEPRPAAVVDPVRVSTRSSGGTFSIRVAGELDLLLVPEFQSAARTATETAARTIVLDLSACRLIDSAGLTAVIVLYHEAITGGQELMILPGGRFVTTTFDIPGLLDQLPSGV